MFLFQTKLPLSETGLNNKMNVFLSFALKENLTSPEEFKDEMVSVEAKFLSVLGVDRAVYGYFYISFYRI